MPEINVIKPFQFSENGLEVTSFGVGKHTVSELCARYAEVYGHLEQKEESVPKPQSKGKKA